MSSIKPGDLVKANFDKKSENLVLWCDLQGKSDDVSGEVPNDTILLVLKVEKPSFTNPTPQWKTGAAYVLAPNNITGWVGLGWIQQVTSGSAARQ